MLLQNEARDVGKSGVLESAKATIKTSPKIFNFFADQTYANKPRAICRELVANAVDSHVMAGKPNEPVEVWLPGLVDPVFKVRDFGLGMSHEFMMTQFMCYADGSTKDGSNVAIGGFGIGSKSPFAYVDQYTVKSVFDGTVSIYSIFKDEDGIPSIALMAQRSTDDPNGVEVSFPVEPSDFENFKEAAFEALKYFEPLPALRGAGGKVLEGPEYASKGKTWGMRKTAGPLQVIMGGVMYPVDANNLTYKFKDETARKMLTYGLDIRVPIGTCSIALSREQLSYDEQTIEGLTKACLSVVDEVAKSFSNMFDHHKSLWDAKSALWDEVHPNQRQYGVSVRGQFLASHALYKGQELKVEHKFGLPAGVSLWDLDPANYRRGGKVPSSVKWEHYTPSVSPTVTISPGRYELVIIDDLPQSPKSKTIARIKELLANQPQEKRVLTVRPMIVNDKQVPAKDVLAALGNPSNHVLTSSLPEPATVTTATIAGTKQPRPRVRMFTFDGTKSHYGWNGKQYPDVLNPAGYGKKGLKEIAYADQPDKGILVTMETWRPPAGFYDKMDLGLVQFDELHFCNKADAEKLDKTMWKDFEPIFQERLAKKIKASTGLGERLAVEQEFNKHFDWQLKEFIKTKTFNFTPAQKKTAFAQIVEIFHSHLKGISDTERKFAPFVTQQLPKGMDVAKLAATFKSSRAKRLLSMTSYRPQGDDFVWFLEELK